MNKQAIAGLFAAVSIASYPLLAQARDDALLAAARAAEPAVIDSLRELVAIESGTMDKAGLTRISDDLERRLRALGAAVERRQTTAGNSDVLVARFDGTGKRRLMLMGHMDTIYFPGTLSTQLIKQEGNRLYGPGIADDKGGLAVMLHAVALLNSAGWRDYARLTLLINGDEESNSPGSAKIIAEVAAEHDVVLSYEPTAARESPQGEGVLLATAGAGNIQMIVKGRNAHAGVAPQLGRNALIEAAYQMVQTQDIAKDIPGAALVWTTMTTGTVSNQIPALATAGADVRLTRTDALEKLMAALQARVADGKRVPDTEVSFRPNVLRPPFVGGERTLALAKRAQAIYAELDGRKLALHPGSGGGTDASFAAQSGKPVVLESMGLPGAGYHARDEYIEIDAIVPRLYLTCRLLMQVAGD